ncbi:DUF2905 domain-containing protein [Mucilaginibacter hurinus]|uniref:DUF2905 domain-containing protein n=1 Tax=Mucilaginibacter hurinus TaxID=2201324 RepID=A0A367GN54_9SPHI|nr:DUF2905 domain-containing protein [Mucilaginibacter hurinus]RCH54907.1 DUF2905 domain-containing protein [Mucilaginibacter hurinus]
MPLNSETGKYIIAAGLVIVLAGLIIYFFGGRLNWIGRLPGDIRVERENFNFYFPLTTLLLINLIIFLLIRIWRWIN